MTTKPEPFREGQRVWVQHEVRPLAAEVLAKLDDGLYRVLLAGAEQPITLPGVCLRSSPVRAKEKAEK